MNLGIFSLFIVAPFVAASIAATIFVTQTFQRDYAEAVCRIESVRQHALDDLANNRAMEANFGGNECIVTLTPTLLLQESQTPVPTP